MVFLKVYVSVEIAECVVAEPLQRLLHVPLDSVLMKFVKDEMSEGISRACRRRLREIRGVQSPQSTLTFQRPLSETHYLTTRLWPNEQADIPGMAGSTTLSPPRTPILLDTIWATQRRRAAEA